MPMEKIPADKLPVHIAIIMDGNGRWARKRLQPRIQGHRRGIEVARDMVTFCRELGVRYLTLYTFSKENWNRPAHEVNMLMSLLERHLRGEEKSLMENNIRFRAIGNMDDLPPSVRQVIEDLEEKTRPNDGMNLQLALSYSGREEIVGAAKALAKSVADGTLSPGDIDEKAFRERLYTADMPDPDLLIRTSGEMRISNFLLWQLAYTEIYVTDVLWPDFTREHLVEAIRDYGTRERRFGMTTGGARGVGVAG